MSQSLSPEQLTRLCGLIQALCDERITPDERAELEAWVCREKAASRIYVQYMNLCASMEWDKAQEPGVASGPRGGRAPVLGFLADAFRGGTDLLSRPLVLSLVFAFALPGLILTILLVSLRSQPAPEVAAQHTAAPQVEVAPATVARVTETRECAWEPAGEAPSVGSVLVAHRPLRLRKGLVEITFDGGARVLVQGPATFDPQSASEGFLRDGRLVAHVSREARGFAVETAAAKIVDLGTEFGVAVEEQGRTAEVQVFQGEVELSSPAGVAAKGVRLPRHRLTAGRAARAALAGPSQPPAFVEIAAAADRFVRSLPEPADSAHRVVVAEFSGGRGNVQQDQYPGAAGAGWASGWAYRGAKGMPFAASVERANPVLGGGDYLRVLIEHPSSNARARCGIERCVDIAGPVDLTKPHVVVFSLRIDALGWFDRESDQLVLCSLSKTDMDVQGARSGWHIRVDARDYPGVKAGNWSFLSGDGRGDYKRFDSGVAAREGETYSFRILADPAARTWTPSIAVSGGEWRAYTPMGMRSVGTAQERGYWPHLYLYWVLSGAGQGRNVEKLGFSLDSIRISAAEGSRGK
jgi:hypothetical protein